MSLSSSTEAIFYQIADEFEASKKPQLLYPCSPPRAQWLARKWLEFRKREAAQSVFYLEPSDPAFGLGFYYFITSEPVEDGLLFLHDKNPHMSASHAILIAAFRNQSTEFIGPNAPGQLARDRYVLKNRYPPEYHIYFDSIAIETLSYTHAIARSGNVNPLGLTDTAPEPPANILIDPIGDLDTDPEPD